ncbi:hypothetical protein [Pengzhenrongella sicca]|uniref:Uncharacterized protein n=1 Tax=Pengzhenrongella sicca TaxID=2819238 RepID=A0A8A4ZC06_9MICO|nr:hypothetical protein [Pengzhenrongella sicca]QTE28951.1 hypothetical protein J4E96_16775 [Pengzhenrongella sicca]
MRDLAGVAALAVALLWIAYLVPHRLRHRQQLLESCAEDRYSAALRVLAVADPAGRARRAGEARAECGPGSEKRSVLLTARHGPAARGYDAAAARGGRIVDRPHGTQDKISADAARRAAQQRAQRAATLARRGAAARRRAALTVALLAISAAAWIVVGVTTVAVVAAVAPSVALVGVLALGRRAVVHGHAADAAWERRAPVRTGGSQTAAVASTVGVVGRAAHPSEAHTEVIERIRDAATAPEQGAPSADSTAAGTAADGSSADDAAGASAAWSPVPVPRPVYTTKAAAPRREPIPLVLDEPEPAAATSAATSSDEEQVTGDVGRADLEAVDEGANPTLDLDAILARRRTAG